MGHKFKYSKVEILKLMRPIAEAIINKPKSIVRTAIEEIMPWDDYVAMVKDMEEYNRIDNPKKESYRSPQIEGLDESPNFAVYQFKITLNGIRPAIWRTIQVESNITLKRLAATILAVMGWENRHMHQFDIDNTFYSIPTGEDEPFNDGIIDERKIRLCDIDITDLKRFKFEYDFGDGWKHTIVLEKNMQPKYDVKYPICVKGSRQCPPEDCGGPYLFNDFIESTTDPKHPDHKKMVKWFGGNFDPSEFDIDSINTQLNEKIKKFEIGMEPMPNLLNLFVKEKKEF